MRWVILALLILFFSCDKKNNICLYQTQAKGINKKKKQADTVSFIFMGDIMGHTPLLYAAYNKDEKAYNFDSFFKGISTIINNSDYALANLELTLAEKPFTGYPTFSSPIELAKSCKDNGIDILVTANNHSCDRGKKGIIKTIEALNNLKISHIGTYKTQKERDSNNLLVLEKKGIKIGVLNYTYGTNGLPVPKGMVVNLIDTTQIKKDIKNSQKFDIDKLIVFIHWGNEYQLEANKSQRKLANFLHGNGVDVIIGSHPHVIQNMEFFNQEEKGKEKLTVYSLGNFISNQRKPNTDGGAMVKIEFIKENDTTMLLPPHFYLTWVDKFLKNGGNKYEIKSCEFSNSQEMTKKSFKQMSVFVNKTRQRLIKQNKNVIEIRR